MLVAVLDALAVIGFRRSLRANDRRRLSDCLFVNTFDDYGVLIRDFERNSVLFVEVNDVAVTEVESQRLSLKSCSVTDADDLEFLRVSGRNADYHVVKKRSRKTVKTSVLFFIGRTLYVDNVAFLLDGHSGAEVFGESSERSFYRYDVALGNFNGNACGNVYGHSSYS